MTVNEAFMALVYDEGLVSRIHSQLNNLFPSRRICSVLLYYGLCRFAQSGVTCGEEVAEVVSRSGRSRRLVISVWTHILKELLLACKPLPQHTVNYIVSLCELLGFFLYSKSLIRVSSERRINFAKYLFPFFIAVKLLVGTSKVYGEWRTQKVVEEVVVEDDSTDISSSASCAICMSSPIVVPTATVCGHSFCWKCILSWVNQAASCPSCRTECRPQDLLPLVGHSPDTVPFWKQGWA